MWVKRQSNHEEEIACGRHGSAAPRSGIGERGPAGNSIGGWFRSKPQAQRGRTQRHKRRDGTEAPAAPNRAGQGPTADEIRFAVTFTRIVSALTRSPHYKHYTLSDLEWLVVPPILTGQCAVMEAKVDGRQVPVAAAASPRTAACCCCARPSVSLASARGSPAASPIVAIQAGSSIGSSS